MSDDGFIHDPIETGFDRVITATVNPEPEKLTPEGREAMKALVPFKQEQGSPAFLATLAREIAMDIETVDAILKKHGLSNAQYEYLSNHHEYYKKTLLQQVHEWQSLGSTQARLKAQAAAALEAQLPTLGSRMGQASEKLADAVEAAKLFAKIAGVDTDTGGPRGGGEGFTITIDLGADERLTLRSGQAAGAGAKTVGASTVSPDAAGKGAAQPLLAQR